MAVHAVGMSAHVVGETAAPFHVITRWHFTAFATEQVSDWHLDSALQAALAEPLRLLHAVH